MELAVFIAASVDGFIARKDGSVDWLTAAGEPGAVPEGEDYGYKAFYDSVDCLIMGRKSMEVVLTLTDAWPYAGKRVIVLSRTLTRAPEAVAGQVELYAGPLPELIARLESEGHRRAYIDGGATIQSFINAGYALDMTITWIPILLGEGLPLFGRTLGDIPLRHVATAAYPSGLVQSTYEIAGER